MRIRSGPWMVLAVPIAALPSGAAWGQEIRRNQPVLAREITPQLRLSVERGLQYLARRQDPRTGSIENGEGYRVAVDSLAGLAFLASGQAGKGGKYSATVRGLAQSVLSCQSEIGYFQDRKSRMYGHGFATLFLAELYGMTEEMDERVRSGLKRAVRVIEMSQSPQGGWDYLPAPSFLGSFEGGGRSGSDSSITVCQTMALRAARGLGIQVDPQVVARARKYIRDAQNEDGGFSYRLDIPFGFGRESKFPRSAAGVCILINLATPEEYGSKELQKGFQYLLRHYRERDQFEFYGAYYCAQAMFQAGGKYWEEYFAYLKDQLLRNQKEDGSWAPRLLIGPPEVPLQTTAMALIALQVPMRFLPILER